MVTGDQIALIGISSGEEINRDAKFVDAISKLIHAETTKQLPKYCHSSMILKKLYKMHGEM